MNADGCSSNGRWQGVFLDFYGTIASGDVQAVEGVCRQVIEDYGLAITAEKMAGLWGHRFFAAIEALGENRFKSLKQIEAETLIQTVLPLTGPIRVEKYIHSFNDFLARPTLYDEVRHVLESLTVPTCIVSNADDEELRAAIEHHGLRFDFVISSETARSYKPDRGIFDAALKATSWRSDRVVHVGDSLHSDVGGARRAGLRTAWVNRTVRISDIGTDRPDYTWPDLRPLVDLTSCR